MDNNWISEHQQINYLVTLDDSENSIYRTEYSFISKYTPLFNFRNSSFFDTLKRCTTDLTLCDSISIFNNYRPEKRKRRLPQDFKADGTVKYEELSRDDVKTIAEGVEDEKQLNILKELGCDEVQGYIWSKPLTPHEFEEKYLNGRLDEFI